MDAEMFAQIAEYRRDTQRILVCFAHDHGATAAAPADGFVLSDDIWRAGPVEWPQVLEQVLTAGAAGRLRAQGVDVGVLALSVVAELERASIGPRAGVLRRPAGGDVRSVCFYKLHQHLEGPQSISSRVARCLEQRDASLRWPPAGLLEEVYAAAAELERRSAAPAPGQLRLLAAAHADGAASRYTTDRRIPVEGAPGWELSATIEPTTEAEWMVMVDRHWAGPAQPRQPMPPLIGVRLLVQGDDGGDEHDLTPEAPVAFWYESRPLGDRPVLVARARDVKTS